MKLIRKQLIFKATEFNDEQFTIRGVFSAGGEDRQGEVIDQKGWKLEDYMANPVVLFAHDHYQPAVAQVIELFLNAQDQLEGVMKFAAEEYDFAMTLYKLYKGKYMRMFSVGFENLSYEIDNENDIVLLKENRLFEISVVNVGANALALASQKGIDIEPIEKMIDLRDKNLEKDKENKEDPEKLEVKIKLEEKQTNTIQSVIRTLTEILNTAGTDNQSCQAGRQPLKEGGKTISVNTFNKAIRQLMKVKKSL